MAILSTLAATVDNTGISAPAFEQIYESLQDSFRLIYGSDIYIEPDSQDGQFLELIAEAVHDTNQMAIAVFQSFSPSFAQGAGLSSNVKINGIARLVESYSTAVGEIIGQAGVTIFNGSVKDINNNIWDLPPEVTIPYTGSILVTVTSRIPGNVTAAAGTINIINTITAGWQSFTSTTDATEGAPIETDALLRRRQSKSVALPSLTVNGGIAGALANLPSVSRIRLYENDTSVIDANGLPEHSISAVIEGGSVADIVNVIGLKKTPGTGTYGTTTGVFTDPTTGVQRDIDFFVLAQSVINVVINIQALSGFNTTFSDAIKQSVASYLNSLEIGEDVEYYRLVDPIYLNQLPSSLTYKLSSFTLALGAGVAGTTDIIVPFNSAAVCDLNANITVNVA